MQETINFLLLTLLLSTSINLSLAASPADFLRSSCNATAYPTVCLQSLSTYAHSIRQNPRQLAHVALTVSAIRAREASTYVSGLSSSVKPKSVLPSQGSTAFQDCVTMMTDSASRLQQSVRELSKLGRAGNPEFAICMSNIQTWVSAALTDQNMCLGSLSQAGAAGGGAAAAAIRKKVVEVSQVTSNALSLVNKITG